MTHVQVIAELGGCSDGDLSVMRRQIDAAGAAGCDGVKAQWLSDPARLVQRRSATRYAGAYHRIAYPAHWLDVMAEHARSLGMELGCSCYLPEDADVLASRVSFLKVSAFEAGATDVLDAVGRTDCPVLISLGMADHAETMRLVGWRACRMSAGLTTRLLHCVSHYTGAMPVEALNLGVIRAYGLDGWSDHSRDVQMGAAAVLVPPGDAAALAGGLAELLHDRSRRDQLRGVAPAQAAGSTWSSCVERHMEAYRLAAGVAA